MMREWKRMLNDIITDGKCISRKCEAHANSKMSYESTRCNKCKDDFQEVLSYKFEIEDPRSRIIATDITVLLFEVSL